LPQQVHHLLRRMSLPCHFQLLVRSLYDYNWYKSSRAHHQVRLFDLVLSLQGTTQILNEVIEVTLAEDGNQYEIARYALP
jgi:hypothetical protein